MKPMTSRFPKPERTFRILLTLFHAIETVCKVLALLISNLEYYKDTRSQEVRMFLAGGQIGYAKETKSST